MFFPNTFFHQSLRGGIDLTQIFEAQTVLLYSKKRLLDLVRLLPNKVPISQGIRFSRTKTIDNVAIWSKSSE